MDERTLLPVARLRSMRLVLDACLVISALAAPWWLTFFLGIFALFFYGAYEAAFSGFLFDVVHGVGFIAFPTGDFTGTIVALLLTSTALLFRRVTRGG